MQVRPFHVDDAAAVAAVLFASVREGALSEYAPEQVAAWVPAPPSEAVVRGWAGGGRFLLVAVDDDGDVVGWGDLTPDDHVDHLFSAPAAIGTGVGSAVYAELERVARGRGAQRLTVHASELARRLFAARGFTTDARQQVERNGVVLHDYAMHKDL